MSGITDTFSADPLVRSLSRFWRWWTTELGALVPARLNRWLSRDAVDCELRIEDLEHGSALCAAATSVKLDRDDLVRLSRKWGALASASLAVPLGKCFVREVSLPRSAAIRADEILRLDMERTTPFKRGDAFSACILLEGAEAGESVVARQIILRRSIVARHLDDIRAAGLPLRGIYAVAADGMRLPVNLLEPSERRRAPATGWAQSLLVLSSVLLLLTYLAGYALTLLDLDAKLAASAENLRKATDAAQASRKLMTELETSAMQLRQPRLKKFSSTPVVAVWEETTRLLPDGTWLTDLRIDDNGLQMDGQSTNASELIGVLARSASLNSVTFASPVTRDPQRGLERFQIRAQIGRLETSDTALVRARPE
jgi:general secretion pathway protein L